MVVMDEARSGRIAKKWSDSRGHSKTVLRGFADMLVVLGGERKRGVKNDSKTDIQ